MVLVNIQEVVFQLPWSLEIFDVPVLFAHRPYRQGRSAAWEANKFWVAVSLPSSLLTAVHENFRLVTPDNAANAGEILHVYGRGFGMVTPCISERPTPTFESRTSSIVKFERMQPLLKSETVFVGLALPFTGIYQLDLQLPAVLPGSGGKQ